MKFCVFSLGCRVNTYEGQSMINELILRGYEATDSLEWADVYVLNTCSVTSEADKKSRQAVARVKKLNPSAKIFVCGCSSQNNGKPFEEKENVVFVGGSHGKMDFLQNVINYLNNLPFSKSYVTVFPSSYEDDLTPSLTTSRAYLKVQDGCNNFCSYCIIPYLRGRSRSRKLESVEQEARFLSEKTKEIVITGINVSAYGKDIGLSLKDLIKTLGKFNVRKRFGSLECTVIDEELLLLMKENGFCPSFHLSMQSGCDKILKKMNRHYTSRDFLRIVGLIRSVFPDAGITTDVICGFPTENQEDFEQTKETCKQAKFLQMHVFPYSEREGTVACKLPQVEKNVRSARANELILLSKQMKEEFLTEQINKSYDVFIEEKEGDYNVGFTDNFIKVYSSAPIGSYLKHTITSLFRDGVKGEIKYE